MTRVLAVSSILVLALGGAAMAQNTGSSAAASKPGASAQMMSAAQVKQAQNQLKEQGLYDGEIDGIVGPQTRSAITQFQKKEGLKQSASLDEQTYGRLMSMSGQSGSSTQPMSGSSTKPDTSGAPGGTSGAPSGSDQSH